MIKRERQDEKLESKDNRKVERIEKRVSHVSVSPFFFVRIYLVLVWRVAFVNGVGLLTLFVSLVLRARCSSSYGTSGGWNDHSLDSPSTDLHPINAA